MMEDTRENRLSSSTVTLAQSTSRRARGSSPVLPAFLAVVLAATAWASVRVHAEPPQSSFAVPSTGSGEGAVDVRADGAVTLSSLDGPARITLRTDATIASAPRLDATGAITREIGNGITERVEIRDGTIEQSWVIAERPAGRLVIRVSVEGVDWCATDESGLHFRARGDASGFRYGHGTLVDQQGRRTAVPSHWTGDAIELVLPDDLVARTRFPAILDPIVGPEVGVDMPVDHPHRTASAPGVRFDGRQWWVLYEAGNRPSGTLRLTRITTEGRLLDPHGIEVVRQPLATNARFALTATHAFVVWEYSDGIYGARIDLATRAVLDATPIQIHSGSGDIGRPSVATDGTDFYVAYDRFGSEVLGRLVRSDGSVVGASATVLVDSSNGAPQVVFAHDRYIVLQTLAATQLSAIRVGRDGSRLDATPVTLHAAPGGMQALTAAESGDSVIALFSTGSRLTLQAVRVDADGMLGLGDVRDVVTTTTAISNPTLGAFGDRAVASWFELTGAVGSARLVPLGVDGAPTAPPVALEPTVDARRPAAVPGPTSILAAWEQGQYLHGARFQVDGTALDAPQVLSFSAPPQQELVAGYGAGIHLVAYRETRFLDVGLYAARLGPGGAPLDIAGTRITSRTTSMQARGIASVGSELLFVWRQDSRLWGTRFAADGSILANEIPLVSSSTPAVTDAAIAADGAQYLVAWLAGGLRVQRFGVDGTPIGAAVLLSSTAYSPVRVAYTDGVFGILYGTAAGTRPRVGFQRVRTDGSRVDTGTIFDESSQCTRERGQLASGGGRFVAFFCSYGRSLNTIVVPTSGPPGPVRTVVDTSPSAGDWLAAAFDGTSYVAVARIPGVADLTGLVIEDTGLEAVTPRFAITPDENIGHFASLSAQGDGGMLFVYQRNLPEAPYGADRVRARFLGGGLGLGAPCSLPSSCESGHCVDDVCCDAECAGGRPDDCYACSVARGAGTDGTCGVARGGTVCRAAVDGCDSSETCDGVSTLCPLDSLLDCDDRDPCTMDSCSAGLGCDHVLLCEDAGMDAAVPDGGTAAPDADSPDAAVFEPPPDAARSDAARSTDAARFDAEAPDAAVTAAPTTGCGCRSTQAARSVGWSSCLVLAAAFQRARRRRRPAASRSSAACPHA